MSEVSEMMRKVGLRWLDNQARRKAQCSPVIIRKQSQSIATGALASSLTPIVHHTLLCIFWMEGGSPKPPLPKSRPVLVLEAGGGGFWSCEAWRVLEAVVVEERGPRTHSRSPRLSHRIGAMHCGGCEVVEAVLEITTTVVVAGIGRSGRVCRYRRSCGRLDRLPDG
jgi:hypothetical protein